MLSRKGTANHIGPEIEQRQYKGEAADNIGEQNGGIETQEADGLFNEIQCAPIANIFSKSLFQNFTLRNYVTILPRITRRKPFV